MDGKKEALREKIELAFGDVSIPGRNITDLFHVTSSDGEEFFEVFRGKHWRDFPIAKLKDQTYLSRAVSHMTDAAFLFYLPGYLLACLDFPDSEIAPAIFSVLAPSSWDTIIPGYSKGQMDEMRGWTKRDYENRLNLLSSLQRKAIQAFLEYFKELPAYCDPPDVEKSIAYISRLGAGPQPDLNGGGGGT